MSVVRSISLANPARVLSTVLVIHYVENEQEWDVRDIEMFDAGGENLLADGISIGDLPRDTQESIYAALSLAVATRRQRINYVRAVLVDLKADAAAAQHA